MTLQSDRAGQADQTGQGGPARLAAEGAQGGRCEPGARQGSGRGADRIAALVREVDPGAGWAVGGVDGPDAVVEPGGRAIAPDVAGLAGVLAVWPVIGMLVDAGELALHTPLTAYGAADGLPAGITAHHLLTHGSGVSPALVGLAERLCGSPLAGFAADRIWGPLGMTRTGPDADGTLRAPAADLGRFLSHLLAPTGGGPVSRAWTAQSLRIRTGELLPARGLLWHPSAHGSWSHGEGPALWVSPRAQRWAALLPTTPSAPLRTAFREAAFT
ncbi:hypothetical protein [Streptomyces sp. NBC_01264]|uniref:hypothetical protein n=1 Tax=Streptomyces sp. NBC_01264 TaxID=2903804 RepID=UPI002259BD36|nr:hypothetical protein [Streptomyces sp. NBC_01264]MCX4782264.1 hypothetical protein [Streptomyces sp. NBC_01264]